MSAQQPFRWGVGLTDVYRKYRVCMLRVTVERPSGDLATGSAFHVGDGWLVTARHVVQGNTIRELAAHHFANNPVDVKRVVFPREDDVDLALLQTDFSLDHYMSDRLTIEGVPGAWKADHIIIGDHLDDWLGDELVLTNVLVMGYPNIPLVGPSFVAVAGQVNAVVDKYVGTRHPFFVVSQVPRGGFSGGPVISEYGMLLGVVTETLLAMDQPPEAGYAAAISVEPLWNLLGDHGVYPSSNAAFLRELDDGLEYSDLPGRHIWLIECVDCGFRQDGLTQAEAVDLKDAHTRVRKSCEIVALVLMDPEEGSG